MSRKGISNRNKQYLLNRLKDMYGEDFHPIMKMAENAVTLQALADQCHDDDKAKAIKSANDAWSEVAQYTEPKLKAIEVTGEDGGPVEIEVVRRVIVDSGNKDS